MVFSLLVTYLQFFWIGFDAFCYILFVVSKCFPGFIPGLVPGIRIFMVV